MALELIFPTYSLPIPYPIPYTTTSLLTDFHYFPLQRSINSTPNANHKPPQRPAHTTIQAHTKRKTKTKRNRQTPAPFPFPIPQTATRPPRYSVQPPGV